MSTRFYIHGISIVYGDCPCTSVYLERWLSGRRPRSGSGRVLLNRAIEGTRHDLLAESAVQLGEFDALIPRVHWDTFRRQPFRGYDQALVVATQVETQEAVDEQLDAAVVLHISRIDGPTYVKFGAEATATLPGVTEGPVAALLRLALSFACVRFGVRPNSSDPALWWDRVREVGVGRWTVGSALPVEPLPFERPVVWQGAAETREELVSRAAGLKPGGEGAHRLVVVAPVWELPSKLAEAADIVASGRSFSQGIWVSDQAPRPEPERHAFAAPGPWDITPRSGGALAAVVPSWRAAYPEPLRNASWTGGNDDQLSHTSQQIALGQWFCTQMWSMGSALLGQADVLTESIAGHYFWQEPQTTYNHPIWQEQLAGDFSTLREWLASRHDIEAATAEQMMWQSWLVLGPLDVVEKAIEGHPGVFQVSIRTANECVVAGTPEALDDVLLELLNSPRVMASELPFCAVLHCPAAASSQDSWEQWWQPQTAPPVHEPFDLRPTIHHAHQDGVTTFLDIGWSGHFANWIDRVLPEQEHHAIALSKPATWGPTQLFFAAGQLLALGLPVDMDVLRTIGSASTRATWMDLPDAVEGFAEVIETFQTVQTRLAELQHNFVAMQTEAHTEYVNAQSAALETLTQALSQLLDAPDLPDAARTGPE